jgi:DNA-binding response OmpR family regulator
MTSIVVVEDNLSYAEDLAEYLVSVGYDVQIAGSAEAMWAAVAKTPADIILLDLGLPDQDGFQIIPELRRRSPGTGVIVLTARVTLDHRIQGLRLGADAYLTKPIKFPELSAHVEALSRRVLVQDKDSATPAWVLRAQGRQIELKDKGAAALTEREFKFLHLLAQNRQTVPRTALLAGMGETEDQDAAGKIDMLVYRLRKKVRSTLGDELPLLCAYGGGYSLSAAFNLM